MHWLLYKKPVLHDVHELISVLHSEQDLSHSSHLPLIFVK